MEVNFLLCKKSDSTYHTTINQAGNSIFKWQIKRTHHNKEFHQKTSMSFFP